MRQIETIINQPKIRNNVHESVYRSYHIIEYIKEMIKRGDSKETMLEIIEFMENFYPEDHD